MNYKELFKKGLLGVIVSNPKECEDFIKSCGKDINKSVWKNAIGVSRWLPIIFCMYKNRLIITNEDNRELIKIISYEEFMKGGREKMNYKELFKQGKLGVEVSNAKECEDFIKSCGEDLDKTVWKAAVEESEWSSVIFCMCEGLATTNEYDEDLVEIISYEKFMKETGEKIGYKELFEEGRLGVRVTDTKECEDFIILCGEDPNKGEWKKVVEATKWFSTVFCMREDKLAITNGHDGDLVIIDYKNFMEEVNKKMGYKKLFEQGKLGIEIDDVESCKDFIKLCGEDPDNAAWKIIAAWTEHSSLTFYTNNGEIKVFDKCLADECPVRAISYKDFIKGEEEGGVYKELFKREMLGVRVTNLKDRKDMIVKYEEFNDWWKNKLNEKKNEPDLIFCMDEGELFLTNEEDEKLVDVIDYEEFVKEDEEETNSTNDLINRLEKLEQEIASIKQEIMEGK